MYDETFTGYLELLNRLGCAIAVFDENGKIIQLNDEALGALGGNVIYLELLPGRYLENEDFWEKLHKNKTMFSHKALLKAGTQTYKIRGMIHELSRGSNKTRVYLLLFELREERILGSATLERIIENSGFVALHWVADSDNPMLYRARYVSNSINKFGYKRDDFYNGNITINSMIYHEDRQMIKEGIYEHLQNGKHDYTRQYRIVTADNTIVPVHDYVHLVVDFSGQLVGIEVVIFDLLMETERNANLLLLENAVNRSHNIVVVWELKGDGQELRYVSDNMERLGISSSMLRSGKLDYYDYMNEEDRVNVQEVYAQFRRKGYQYLSQEYRLMNDAGQEFWIRDESNLIELPGGTRYIESILTDVSENKRREMQLLAQQEDLQRKLQYIESSDTMLSDLSVTDFIPKDDLQQLQGAIASLTGSYNAVIDLDGDPITYPEGPDANMGAFYDMFERVEYKQGYFQLNKELRKSHEPAMMTLKGIADSNRINGSISSFPEDGDLVTLIKAASKKEQGVTDGVLVGIPLYVNDKHMATWINCAFTEEEVRHIDDYLPSLWTICNYMAEFVYSNTISQQESQKARLSEVQTREVLERNSVINDILRKCNAENAENVLNYVLRKVGDYLHISRVSLFRSEPGQDVPECFYEWDREGLEKNVDWKVPDNNASLYARQQATFMKEGRVVLHGDNLPIRVRKILWENQIRALVAMPLDTKTREQHYITFIESDYERVWKDEELSFMQTIVSILQVFLQRLQENVKVSDVTQSQEAYFDLSREYIYVKDMKTDEILYVNPRLAEHLRADVTGKRCYEVFRRQSIHCMDCYQCGQDTKEVCNSRMYRQIFQFPVRIRETAVNWHGSSDCKVIIISREDEW